MLKIFQQSQGEVEVIALVGKLDAITAFELRPVIEDLLRGGKKRVVFDVTQLSLIDSSGVGAVVSVYKRTRAEGGDTKLAGLGRQPQQVFKILGLDKAFEIFDNVQDAISSFG